MAYSARADFESRMGLEILIQLTDDENLGEVNDDKLNSAIAAADAKIDAYCGTKYNVPFSTVPAQIKEASVAIARYLLYDWKGFDPEDVRKSYEDTIRFLQDISAGRATLGETASPPAESGGGEMKSSTAGKTRIFDDDTLEDF